MPPLARSPNIPDERLRNRAALFEHIGKGPERHHVRPGRRTAERCSPAPVPRRSCRATPSCPAHSTPSRTGADSALRDDLISPANLRHRAAHAIVHGNVFVRPEQIFRRCRPRSRASKQNPPAHGSSAVYFRKSSTQCAAAVAGPPTRSRGFTLLQGRAPCVRIARSRTCLRGMPFQKSMFGSFHTSKYHCATSSMP